MTVTSMGEEGDPTSRYQNPRYSGKGVPDRNQPHNLFNDRRIGGKSKNRAVGESLYNPKKIVRPTRPDHADDKWGWKVK